MIKAVIDLTSDSLDESSNEHESIEMLGGSELRKTYRGTFKCAKIETINISQCQAKMYN